MKLNNDIHIKARHREEEGENDIELTYDSNLTLAEVITTLSFAKEQVLEIAKSYITKDGIEKEEDIDAIYWQMEIRHLL